MWLIKRKQDSKNNTSTPSVSSDSASHNFKSWNFWSKKNIIMCLIGGFILIFVATVAFRMNINHKNAKNKTMQQMYDDIAAAGAKGDVAGAQKLIDNNPQLKNTRDGDMALARVYLNIDNNMSALTALLKSEQTYGLNKQLAGMVAMVYERLSKDEKVSKDGKLILSYKKSAILYYEKRIELIKNGKPYPLAISEIKEAQNSIDRLKQ